MALTRRIAVVFLLLATTLASTPETMLIAWSAPGSGAEPPRLRDIAGLTPWQGGVIFLASDAEHGRAVWTSDGTAAGTRLVRVVDASMTKLHGVAEQFGRTSRAFYFVTDDGTHGDELWRSDGTHGGTHLVRDLTPGAGDSTIRDLEGLGRTLFFARSSTADPTPRLWRSDGSQAGTAVVPHRRWPAPTSPRAMYAWHGAVYFAGTAARAGGTTLWRSDGTAGGTRPVRDLRPDDQGLKALDDFAGAATQLYFVAGYGTGSAYDEGVWRTDGTARHTRLLADVDGHRPVDHTHTSDLTTQGDRLLFVDNDCVHGKEPWGSDGTAAGTTLIDLAPSASPPDCGVGSQPQALTAQGGDFLLVARDPSAPDDPLALYRSDGTPAGTAPYLDLSGTGTYATTRGTLVADRSFLVVGDSTSAALYVTDGTAAGTQVVREIDPQDPADLHPEEMTGAGGLLYATSSTDTLHHQALWVSDGTPAGTLGLTG